MKKFNIILGVISSLATLFLCYIFFVFIDAFIKFDDPWHNLSLFLINFAAFIGIFILFIPFFVLWYKCKRKNMKFSFYSFVSYIFITLVLMVMNLIDMRHFNVNYAIIPLLFLAFTITLLIYLFRKELVAKPLKKI